MLVVITILLAFCGGPLMLCDALTPCLGQRLAFALCFSPLFSMAMGALCSQDVEPGRLGRLFLSSGLLATVLLALIDGWALWLLLSGEVDTNMGLHGLGVLAGGFACLGYVQLWSKGWARTMAVFGRHASEVAVLIVNLGFVAAGLWLLPHNPEVGVVTLLFFGSCAVVSGHTLWASLNPERVTPTHELPRALRRRRTLLVSAFMCALGTALTLCSPSYPLVFRVLMGAVGVLGLGMFVGAALDVFPRDPPPASLDPWVDELD